LKQILYSHGEPAGIGIDLILRIAKLKFWSSINIPIVVISDGELLKARAKLLKLKIEFHELHDLKKTKKNETGCIQFHCVSQCKDFTPGVLNPQNASYVISNLNFAIDAAIENSKIAVVTGPIQKSNIVEGGIKTFQGHTEWIQKRTGSKDAVMLLASKKIKVALATTHIPLSEVPKNIKKAKLINVIKVVNDALKKKFKIRKPKIRVLGLNPHAGESGKIGTEELKIITPAINACKKLGMDIVGPLSADTAFHKNLLQDTDAYIAMFHDQALPVLKALSFGEAINTTLGIPIIRTSVDHGTALEFAGRKKPMLGSLQEAIIQAVIQLK
jgi:4-hydroxythreonine-4-phosphate dehydrogenase